ncbi:hypothetical protein BDK92_0382 [Micromonospora pisi]|uniref:Uncharacterized protein n=1 Tax=Micromonospora pisi TaxID=589240 RepID=A0A495JAW8_9ACTN|nr:hypothetical protein [Micromonospora pisi]RKR86160.1 hypothetical protein BDK92_0382 [Micromonospora pisi]
MREGAQEITIDARTTVKWFAVDIAGNVENNYQPAGTRNNYRTQTLYVPKS